MACVLFFFFKQRGTGNWSLQMPLIHLPKFNIPDINRPAIQNPDRAKSHVSKNLPNLVLMHQQTQNKMIMKLLCIVQKDKPSPITQCDTFYQLVPLLQHTHTRHLIIVDRLEFS